MFEVRDTNSRFDYKYDALVLSEAGKIKAQNCREAGSSFHSQCFDNSLYCSVKESINITTDNIIVIDATKTKPNEGRVLRSHRYGEIIKTKVIHKEHMSNEAPEKIPNEESQPIDFEEPDKVCINSDPSIRHSSNKNARKHIKEGHSVQCDSFQCDICYKSFKQQRYLRRHMKMHAATKNDRIKCPDCTATFAREDNMKKHQFYKHLDPNHCFVCAICEKIFTHEQHVLRHIRHEHEDSYQKFKCDICDAEFNEKGNLTSHMNKHAGTSKDRVKCPECPQTFSQNSDMKRHLLRMHVDPTLRYICYFCDRVFKHKKNMQSHINQVHEQNKSFQCSICNKEYTDKNSLKRHTKSHTGQGYECWECPATFVRRRDLKRHEKQGEHNYSELNCEFCNETFIFKCWNDEDNHFNYHLGKRTHCVRSRLIVHSLCEKCGYMHGWCRCIPHNYPIVFKGSADEEKADLAKEPVNHYPTLPELPEAKTFAEAMSNKRKKAEKNYIKQRDELLSNNYKITLTDVLSQRLKEPEKIKKTRYQMWLEGLGNEERRSLKLHEPNDFWYEHEEYEKFRKYHFEDLSQKYYCDWVEKKKNWKRNKSNK